MDKEKLPVLRGRGAALMKALRENQKPGVAPGASTQEQMASQEEPRPAPRGRGSILQKLAQLKQTRASVGEVQTATSEIATVVESLATTTLNEPCLYRGSSGSSVPVACNYIRLTADADCGVFEYNVGFKPQIDAKSIRDRTVHQHLGPVKLFDGGSILYLPVRLAEKTEYVCQHPHDGSEFTMFVTFIKQKKLGECLHLFNILFKRIMRALLLSQVGRNYFDPHNSRMIPQHKLEVLPGYAVAVDEFEGGVMLCLDTQHRVMRTQSVYDFLIDLQCTHRERMQEQATKALLGSIVLTRYNNKTYRVDHIVWNENPQSTFKSHDGRDVSFIEYYKKQYGIDIQDIEQPLLVNNVAKKQAGAAEKVDRMICLVPELCFLTGLTDEMRSDFKVMKAVAEVTRITPAQRMSALRKYLENIENSPKAKKILQEWGLRLDNKTVNLLGRVLDPETILFGEGKTCSSDKAEWNSQVSRHKMLGPIDLKKWYVFHTRNDKGTAGNFADAMIRLAGPLGMRIGRPKMYELQNDRTETYISILKTIPIEENQILVFICPTIRDDRYSAIKRYCCAEAPIPTQVVNTRTLMNPKRANAIITKIALQMNCKLGGTLWSLRFPVTTWMICGIDVFHSPGSKQSVCGFVASINETITRWYSMAIFQGQELGDHFKIPFAKALEKFREINGTFPTNVVIFRDGVGDGQLNSCKEHEVSQFHRCLADYDLSHIKVTMVVVQKRINTRLFLSKGNALENPSPGTIVDNAITRKSWYDFFLIAQHVNQGTVTPTHYVVVHDTAKLRPDHVQKLTYKLCHLYYNWSGTIRVPAPCQYAHKLAYLVGQHIRKQPSAALNDRLYYL